MEHKQHKPEEYLGNVTVAVGEPIQYGIGDISASNFTPAEAHELANVIKDTYLVSIREGAAGCCIDGRLCRETIGHTLPEPSPSVAGGPSVTAFAGAELIGDYFKASSSDGVLKRINDVGDTLVSHGIVLGAHVSHDDLEGTAGLFMKDGVPRTGCGASDKFIDVLERPYDHAAQVTQITEQLLGPSVNPNHLNFIEDSILRGRIAGYNARDVMDNIASRDDGRNVEILEGKHAETLVVFNYIENTTVDRDALVGDTGKQVFVIDMWYIDKLACALAAGRTEEDLESRLRHAMTAFQVSTYLTLCDGTHRPVILRSSPTLEGVAPVS
jgi:hypothetical protein